MGGHGKVRVAVIGAGYWGPNLIRNFSQLKDVEVSLVCDVDRSRLDHIRDLYPHVSVSDNYQEATRGTDVDAICVATPVRWHYEMAKDALLHDKHVMVEKPLTSDVGQAEELVQLAESRGRVLLVDHTFEYTPAVNKIREMIVNGDLGEIYYVSMSRLNLGLFQKDINVIWDLAPHDISILNFTLGHSPEAVSANGNANILPDIEDVAMLTLYYPGNLIAYIQVSWLDPRKTRQATFVGNRKMLVYDDVEPLEKLKVYDKGVEGPKHYDTFGEFQLSYRYGDIYTPFLDSHEPLTMGCKHFLDCILRDALPKSGGPEGLSVVRVLEGAQRSLKKGGAKEAIEYKRGDQ
ncbi:MAG: oxidoreductase [Gemmatimonadetes bacterium]|nr:oxidoreductase [Gemmatimonadota bacterium]|tara:strand:- start:15860 stop:16903 length:1044 start_codon:yes stop_codon:yes gene_type:complete